MSMGQLKYFFSYSRKDTEFVLKLATELRAVGVDVWLDQLDILGGQRWDRAIEDALKGCQGTIAVLSPESLSSNNVMDEVSYALEEGKLVVPILLRRCDIPFRLRLVQHVDFSIDYDLGFRQLLRALRVEPPPVMTQPPAVRTKVIEEFAEPQAAKAQVAEAIADPQAVKVQATQEFTGSEPLKAQDAEVFAKPQAARAKVAEEAAEPRAVKAPVPAEFIESSPVKTQPAQVFAQSLGGPSTTTSTHPSPAQKTQRMFLLAIGILLILWLLGIGLHLAGGLIHILLVVSVILLIYKLVSGRRESKVLHTTTAPAFATAGAFARHPTRVGILAGAAAGVIWAAIAIRLVSPNSGFETILVGMAFLGPAGAIAGAICKMRSRIVVAAIAGGLVGWFLYSKLAFQPPMTEAVFGSSIGMVAGSIAGVIIERVRGWM